jgi:hypothetical protein
LKVVVFQSEMITPPTLAPLPRRPLSRMPVRPAPQPAPAQRPAWTGPHRQGLRPWTPPRAPPLDPARDASLDPFAGSPLGPPPPATFRRAHLPLPPNHHNYGPIQAACRPRASP